MYLTPEATYISILSYPRNIHHLYTRFEGFLVAPPCSSFLVLSSTTGFNYRPTLGREVFSPAKQLHVIHCKVYFTSILS